MPDYSYRSVAECGFNTEVTGTKAIHLFKAKPIDSKCCFKLEAGSEDLNKKELVFYVYLPKIPFL